jgi:hypothetical protein
MLQVLQSFKHSTPALRPTQPPYRMGTGGSFQGGKVAEREADHSSPTSAGVKKSWIYTSTPTCVLMTQCLIR